MGAVYHMDCPACGYNRDFYTGCGASDERRANEALMMLETGADADNVQAMLLSEPDAYMYLERAVYRCRFCGTLHERICTRVIGRERTLTGSYRCPDCGRLMGRIHEFEFKKLPCPSCGAALNCTRTGDWDIAPSCELRQNVNEKPRNIVPLATECFKLRDSRGYTAFVPIKSDMQLNRLQSGGVYSPTMLDSLDAARKSNCGYWLMMSESCDALLATFPAMLIRTGEDGIRALEEGIARAYPDMCGAWVRSAYIECEPFNIVSVAGREGLLAYSIWTLPELNDAASAMRSALQNRVALNFRGDR